MLIHPDKPPNQGTQLYLSTTTVSHNSHCTQHPRRLLQSETQILIRVKAFSGLTPRLNIASEVECFTAHSVAPAVTSVCPCGRRLVRQSSARIAIPHCQPRRPVTIPYRQLPRRSRSRRDVVAAARRDPEARRDIPRWEGSYEPIKEPLGNGVNFSEDVIVKSQTLCVKFAGTSGNRSGFCLRAAPFGALPDVRRDQAA